MNEALRASGLDELAWAESLVHVVDTLKGKTDKTGSVEKLLLDALKECSRHLDSPDASRSRSGPAPVFVQLVHTVSRPARALLPPPKAEDVVPTAS